MTPWKTGLLARKILHGAVFAYPTDTIWGLGCHPLQAASVERLQRIKLRARHKGLILLSADRDYLATFIDRTAFSALQQALQQPTTHPITWICKASPLCPRQLTGQRDTIAVRITDREPAASLSHHIKMPLVSTSANISGRSPVRNHWLAHKHFGHQLDFIVEGFHYPARPASQIRDLQSGVIIRP